MPGPRSVLDTTYWNDAQMAQHRAVIIGSGDGSIALPSANDPYPPPVGISRDGCAAGQQEAVREVGTEWCELAGTATAGKPARVMADGKVQNAAVNATPVQQTIVGYFRTSGSAGDLALVKVAPGVVTL